ncbi:hypothetical protein KUV23_10815 [Algoriphagus marincola]|jgi:hypothetical protein|uniref:Bacteriocin-type signal sequence-containing protein n=2 Tax=Algoriphagus TaxID=246875 RepID=A0ABS7N550_9BACT|nr:MULTISPECIES: hypothetical protein [Algoriphagus]MBY5951467.1 hypothetical protein [Algoriphagus marincola]GMQ30885.1 hypothetical protein Aconfl_35280 [Algoriphagus confluentis]
MEKLTNDQMENLVGSGYCEDAELLLFGGGFQGSDELWLLLYDTWVANCPQA